MSNGYEITFVLGDPTRYYHCGFLLGGEVLRVTLDFYVIQDIARKIRTTQKLSKKGFWLHSFLSLCRLEMRA